jgi:PleD family two-component response regulator
MAEPLIRQPLVLVASHGEWVGRSVESVLGLNGYNVLRVEGGRRALDVARQTSPDALILETGLSEIDGISVCRALSRDPLFDQSTPIFVTSPAPASNRVRTEAFEAGAWDFSTHPFDVEIIQLKLATFLRARRRIADAQSASFIDPLTGLYSARGLSHWAAQIGARASRNHEPLACVVVTTTAVGTAAGAGQPVSVALTSMAELCRSKSRKSDIVGYVGESRFAILAPETDEMGARQFVGRLKEALGSSLPHADVERSLHAGFYAVADFAASNVEPTEVVGRAETALRHALSGGAGAVPLSFDDLPAG